VDPPEASHDTAADRCGNLAGNNPMHHQCKHYTAAASVAIPNWDGIGIWLEPVSIRLRYGR
jgi:hypothetical protein